jgi:HEAT repeat protein
MQETLKTLGRYEPIATPSARRLRGAICSMMAIAVCICVVAPARSQELKKLNRFTQSSGSSDAATKALNEGRDSIQDEDWEKAVQRFTDFIRTYSNDSKVDAALYWLAYALTRLEKFPEADEKLARLIGTYPKSSWIEDARTLRIAIAPRLGKREMMVTEIEGEGNDEIKSAALEGLFENDPRRATEAAARILQPDSKSSRRLKENAVNLLGQHQSKEATAALVAVARGQALSRDQALPRDGDSRIRKLAVFWLGQADDEAVLDLLNELATKSADADLAKIAVLSISRHRTPRATLLLSEVARSSATRAARQEAIHRLGQRRDEAAFDELLKIYDSDRDPETRKQVIFALAQMKNPRAEAKLLEVARTSPDVEVRKQAVLWLGQRQTEQAVDELIRLYDPEKNLEVKEQILFALSQSKQKAALRKLMAVARSDSSVELRKKAIFWLGQSKDPEAVKLLEELAR